MTKKGSIWSEPKNKILKKLIREDIIQINVHNGIDLLFNGKHENINERNHMLGICKPYNENTNCSSYLGIYIAERLLPSIFEEPKMMPFGNRGFNAICKNGYKIDVKSSCLYNRYDGVPYWQFNISRNQIADFFLMFGFDNRTDLNPIHIWLIKGKESLQIGGRLQHKHGLCITNTKEVLKKYRRYELTDKMNKVLDICNNFKIENHDLLSMNKVRY